MSMSLEISIATGKSRKTKVWQNTKILWPAFVEKIEHTLYTLETYKEYCAFTKEQQAEIKDRGGFVGGYLKAGKRSPANVTFRQVLTLDIDFATLGFWDDFTIFFNCEALLHSTHKHSEDSPRYRLIIPLDRITTREEYEAVARKIADNLGINLFDPTTFQPERLMYWPTTSKNATYVFKHQTGLLLNADSILSTYTDWKDISEWAKPDSQKEAIYDGLKLVGKPEDKPGLIGAFCRTYDVVDVINTFLSDIYEETVNPERYTYKQGTTAAGAVLYGENQFIYSHHSTDPICNKLCNAFDLVRLHLYGKEDTDSKATTITSMPSYKRMIDFARGIPEVVKQLAAVNLPEEELTDWLGQLTVDKLGNTETTIDNFKLILLNDVNLTGRIKYDEFNNRDTAIRPMPWDKETNKTPEFTDKDDAELRSYIEKKYGIYHVPKGKDAFDTVTNKFKFHPVRDYLNTLKWDKTLRLEKLLVDYMGAPDNLFVKETTRKAFTAAVARIHQPGIKFDYVLTLVGKQGIGKSTLFAKMGKEWFSDSFVGVEGNRAFEQLQGTWIMEIGELAGIKKAEVEAVKHFITKTEDRFRVAYGKRLAYFKRQNVFFATTNKSEFLRDYTGNRRFWPIEVSVGLKHIADIEVDQLWAEAKHYYENGERLYLDAVLEEEAVEVQLRHTESDDRAGLIEAYINMPLPKNWGNMSVNERRGYLTSNDPLREVGTLKRTAFCVAEIWCEILKADPKDMGSNNTKWIHDLVSDMKGWEKTKQNINFPIYGRQRAYAIKSEVTNWSSKTILK
jgi:putative DNA primase/helicase